jgi:hypothetical protein
MNGESPSIYFAHFWGKGKAQDLEKGIRRAQGTSEYFQQRCRCQTQLTNSTPTIKQRVTFRTNAVSSLV